MSESHDIQPTKDWRCSENECPSFDGKRCMLLGYSPSEFCEPKLKLVRLSLKKKRRKIRALKSILEDFRDSVPCDLDRNQHCQAHNWFGDAECPHKRAAELLD